MMKLLLFFIEQDQIRCLSRLSTEVQADCESPGREAHACGMCDAVVRETVPEEYG